MLGLASARSFRAALSGLFLAALLALTAAGSAAAGPPPVSISEPPLSFSVDIQVRGSHGYNLTIEALNHRTVSLVVAKAGNADTPLTLYSAPGRATRDRVEADFGELGRVSLRFTPANKRAFSDPHKGCTPHPGRFDGVIRFRGEQGFTQVRAKRAKGTVDPDGGGRCVIKRAGARPGPLRTLANVQPELLATALGAVARSEDRSVAFYDIDLSEKRAGVLAVPLAAVEEERGRVSILRLALELLDRPVAIPSPAGVQPFNITIAPPAPFQGTGSYLAPPGVAPTWTGDLAVDFPGIGRVPLTGPEFVTKICNGALHQATQACLDDLRDFIEPRGSQLASL
ncbi:MAG TPA: hypothetical protein VFX45_11380 [Solirubrobacterales bacterium]|nr:hypothetical protein [Solirubrobacterales bacterium]